MQYFPTLTLSQEIENLFSLMPNYGGVRLVKKATEVIAFVDFEDAASAYVAMVIMQVIHSSVIHPSP